MFDLAFIQQCADPGVEIAIVERFIAEAGTDNPLAISITSGNRVILPESPHTPEAALSLVKQYVGKATVRVGVTRYPAGQGTSDVSEVDARLVDACENMRMGTALFGKVYRIVSHAHGAADQAVFEESIEAWRTGMFEGSYIFGDPDPGPLQPSSIAGGTVEDATRGGLDQGEEGSPAVERSAGDSDPRKAGIRIDLSRISGDRRQ